jgi:hypothetical protein
MADGRAQGKGRLVTPALTRRSAQLSVVGAEPGGAVAQRVFMAALAGAWIAAGAAAAAPSDLARQLLQGCLAPPTLESVTALAEAAGATPFSKARNSKGIGKQDPVFASDGAPRGQSQRTDQTITQFRGWDLPGRGAGSIAYEEDEFRSVFVDRVSGQELEAPRFSRSRGCHVSAPVANVRRIFELYESLHDQDYGILIAPDRKSFGVFVYEPTHADIELWFSLDRPIPGVPPAAPGEVMARMQLSDGGPRFMNGVPDGISTTAFTRAALLAAVDGPGEMSFGNTAIEATVQRLSAAPRRGATGH